MFWRRNKGSDFISLGLNDYTPPTEAAETQAETKAEPVVEPAEVEAKAAQPIAGTPGVRWPEAGRDAVVATAPAMCNGLAIADSVLLSGPRP